MIQTIPLNVYKVFEFAESITDRLCHRILTEEQNTIAFVYGNSNGELAVIPLDEQSKPIKINGFGCISSIASVYIKRGLYNIFVITIDGSLTLVSLIYKYSQLNTKNTVLEYKFIIEQSYSVPTSCTCSLALSYGNEKDVILILGCNTGNLYGYKYNFRGNFDKTLLKMSFEGPIEYIYPFYTSTLMNTKLLISFSRTQSLIVTLNGTIEQLHSIKLCNHNNMTKEDIAEWIYPVYGKTPTIFQFCSCGVFTVNGVEKTLNSHISTIWAAIMQRGDLNTNNKQCIYDCFMIRDSEDKIRFIDQKGDQFYLNISGNIQCIKTIKMCIEEHDEQIVVVFTPTQIVLYRGLIPNYFDITTSQKEKNNNKTKLTKEQIQQYFNKIYTS